MPCNCFTYPCACEDGDYYADDGSFHPGGSKLPYNNVPMDSPYYNTCNYLYDKNCPNPNTMNDPLLPPNIRPITNTNYPALNTPPVINQWDLSSLFNPQNTALTNSAATSSTSATGIIGTLQAHPVLALGGAALLLYFFMGSGGGTYEQITTKRKGFGS